MNIEREGRKCVCVREREREREEKVREREREGKQGNHNSESDRNKERGMYMERQLDRKRGGSKNKHPVQTCVEYEHYRLEMVN